MDVLSSRSDRSDYFELVQPGVSSTDNNGGQQLQLIVRRPLDRETIAQHNLSLVACDGGQPSSCGHMRLVINMGDINDNSPIFRREHYEFSVVENATAGTPVGRIEAYDLDAGVNQKIRYKLMGVTAEATFRLDELTGLLTLVRSLDYEMDKQFTFKVNQPTNSNLIIY